VGLKLKEMGFTKVSALQGGWREWLGAGYPTEKKNPAKGELSPKESAPRLRLRVA
jgi:3-mercaptopyruvate sulfurtransferase SseA